jgi:hypothetical protein
MTTSINALRVRKVLGRANFHPPEPFGPDGWYFTHHNGTTSVIVSCADFDGIEYLHASVADQTEMPTYDDLCWLHKAVFRDGYAYQVFAPRAQHVNIHGHALHLWGRLDGKPVLPEFGSEGTI